MGVKELLTPLYISIVENKTREKIGYFLNNRLIESKYVFISMWSFLHLFFGGLLFFLIDKFTKGSTQKKFILLFLVLLAYEVMEYFMYTNLSMLFIPETIVDAIWDVVIGMLGGVSVWLFRR